MKEIKLLLLAVLLATTLVACGSKEKEVSLKKDTFTFELGEKIALSKSDVVDTEDKEILKDVKLTLDTDTATASTDGIAINKDIKVGKYKGTIEYKKQRLDFKVIVKDTVAPKFIDFKEKIEIQQNSKDVDYASFFPADDLSSVKITVDSSGVDLSKSGEYAITVTATDEYKNKTEKKSIVVVKEKAEESAKEMDSNELAQTGSTDGTASTAGNTQTNVGSVTNGSAKSGSNNPPVGNNGGGSTHAPSVDVCPGGFDPSLPCDAIYMDLRDGQNHKLFDTYEEVENIMNLWANFKNKEASALAGEDISWAGQMVGTGIYYNDGSEKYSFALYE